MLKMITVFENFDFLDILPVNGEKYCYVTSVFFCRVVEVP